MFDSSSVIVGLEIGTSKVCAVVGELNPNSGLSIIGIGQSPSTGVRKGEIIDPGRAEEDMRRAITEAEQMADVEIRSVYLGVTGGHIRGSNNRGVHRLVSADREIAEPDVRDVITNAKAINLPAHEYLLHAIRQHFCVNGQEGIPNPVGFMGPLLEVDMHVVHGNTNRLQNAIRTVKGLQLEVENVAFTGIASSLALLSNSQKELGCLVIDLGGGATEYVVYANGIIKHTGVLAVGGDHVTNDLAYGLRLSSPRAERLKIEHGAALKAKEDEGKTLTLPADSALQPTVINLEHLHCIMQLRLEEIFQIIAQDMDQTGLLDYLRGGVFLCGGGARTPGITTLAERVFGKRVTLGKTTGINGLSAALDQPEFAAPIGLVKYGSFNHQRREVKASLTHGIKNRLEKMLKWNPLV